MTTKRLTKRRTKLQSNAAEVIAMLASGTTPAEISRIMGVSREAVSKFQQRFAVQIDRVQELVEEETIQYAIANVVNRVADAQFRRDRTMEVVDLRSQGKSARSTGMVAVTYKQIGVDVDQEGNQTPHLVAEERFDASLAKSLREDEEHVAKQLGQNTDQNPTSYIGNFADKQINIFDRAQAHALIEALRNSDDD